ncbi:MAG: hypothetical protein P1V18_01285 [Candidatus Gracilibacteria bacterium]|nr:hypothetical protein [Candidatus Gracilibacteria bacterium]
MKRLSVLLAAFSLLLGSLSSSSAFADELQESPDIFVSAGKQIEGICDYTERINTTFGDQELNQQVRRFLELVRTIQQCPDPKPLSLPEAQYSCRTEETVFYEDMKALQDWVSASYLPENLGNMLPDDEVGIEIIQKLESVLESFEQYYQRQEEAYYDLLDSPCEHYKYIDFPGAERFSDQGYEDVELLYELQPIMSGLVPNEVLGPDMNLVRSHALTALWRILKDQNGIMTVFFKEQTADHRFVDIEKDHPLSSAFAQFAKGYQYSEVVTGVDLERLSWIDLAFLKTVFQQQLMLQQPELETEARFLLPASDILYRDLYHLIQKTFEMSSVVSGLAKESEMLELGLNLNDGTSKLTRLDALPIFYRLQQLNYLLKEHFDEAGFVEQVNQTISFRDMILTPPEALPYFTESMMQKYGSQVGLMKALHSRTQERLSEYWTQWNHFQEDSNETIQAINQATKSLHEPVSLHQRLRSLLLSF